MPSSGCLLHCFRAVNKYESLNTTVSFSLFSKSDTDLLPSIQKTYASAQWRSCLLWHREWCTSGGMAGMHSRGVVHCPGRRGTRQCVCVASSAHPRVCVASIEHPGGAQQALSIPGMCGEHLASWGVGASAMSPSWMAPGVTASAPQPSSASSSAAALDFGGRGKKWQAGKEVLF